MEKTEVHICCCGTKVWALLIGYVQSITCSLSLSLISVYFGLAIIVGVNEGIIDEYNGPLAEFIGSSIILIVILILCLIAGYSLIAGVRQGDEKKLKKYIVLMSVALGFTLVTFTMELWSGDWIGTARDGVGILISILAIWVVNVHRRKVHCESVLPEIGQGSYDEKV